MEAKDLRINNWIIIDGVLVRVRGVYSFTNGSFKNNEGRVDAYRYDSIFEPKEISAGINHFEPIPLTEEWLVKLGFEKLEGWDDMYYFKIGDFQIYEYNVSGYEFDDFEIKHVHQLQNLYFALTNEELILK